jgi:AraC-like DNA-binding protein
VLDDLKIKPKYDGLLYLAESVRHLPQLHLHHHVELELNLVVEGSITYVVGKKCFTFTKRALIWMFPAQEHQLVNRSDNAQFFVAVFKPEMIQRSCRSKAYQALRRRRTADNAVLYTTLEPDLFDLTRKMMDLMMIGSLDPDILNREAGFGLQSKFCFEHKDADGLNAGLHHLLLQCWRFQQESAAPGRHVKLHFAVQRALEILGKNEAEYDLQELARQCGVSEAYLSRTFSQQIGVPLNRYRNSLRLSRFWDHYRRQDGISLTEAVYAAGFGSYAQFYKIFTQAYGRGPRESLTQKVSD